MTNLQDGKLMHLACTRGNHALEQRKLLVHLAPPPPLDKAVCRLPRNLPASSTRGAGLLLLALLLADGARGVTGRGIRLGPSALAALSRILAL